MAGLLDTFNNGVGRMKNLLTPTPRSADSAYRTKQKPEAEDKGQEIITERRRRQQWLENNYWAEWLTTFQNYKCEEDPHLDPNDETKLDPSQTSVGMPDTWGMVRRFVARVTSQPPSHRFIGSDRHVLQAGLFGISVLAWSWAKDASIRRRRVNPLDPKFANEVEEQYKEKLEQYAIDEGTTLDQVKLLGESDPQAKEVIKATFAAKLIEDIGKGNLVPIQYLFKSYEGPKADLLYIGDCYFEPDFQTFQSQNSFIVDRRRNLRYLKDLLKLYPQIKDGLTLLTDTFPDGSTRANTGKSPTNLREKMQGLIERSSEQSLTEGQAALEWTITERHVGGEKPRIDLVAEDGIWIGSIDSPYDLDGKLPFTELTFIDDILCGIGDSTARITRGLNKLHNRLANSRADLVYNLQKPLVGTSDLSLFEEPEKLTRHKGFRLFYTRQGQNALWTHQEGAAMSSAIASLNDESSMQRMMQVASGESNLSLSADVDPQQNRTATGAKIQARAADVLTKDAIDMYTFCLRDQLEMMRLFNRSELGEDIEVDPEQYPMKAGMGLFEGGQQQPAQGQGPEIPVEGQGQEAGQQSAPVPVIVTPEDFQDDGEIQVEVGSTLAEDDDTKLSRAQTGVQLASSFPQVVNLKTALIELLIALGKGKSLSRWIMPPAPPAPPEMPNRSINVPLDKQPPEIQAMILTKYFGIDEELAKQMAAGQPGAMPGAGPSGPSAGPPQPPGPSNGLPMPQGPPPGPPPGPMNGSPQPPVSPNGLTPDQTQI